MAEVKKFTYAQVKEHNKEDDVWMVINEKVYDLTKFLQEHPGGAEVLVEVSGKNATKEFDDVGHSEAAIEQMADFCIGEIADSEKKSKCPKNAILGVSGAVAVALGAYVIYRGYKLMKST